MEDGTNPETGVTDVESAVRFLTTPTPEKKRGAPEERETEAAQEPQEGDEPEEDETEALEASEEDDGETADADSEDEAEEETDDDEPSYTVKVDGEEYEVNLSELVNGYQKGADYSRKTSQLAEERRALQQHAEQVQQMRGQLEAELARLAQGQGEPEPDWEALADDPWEYAKQRTAWERKQQERQQAAMQAQALQAQRLDQIRQQNLGKLLEHFPEWKSDRKKLEADKQAMLDTARAYGFSDQEFYGALDYRAFLLLRDAMRGRKAAQAAKNPPSAKRVPKKARKSLSPGAKTTGAERKASKQDALRDNLRKRGTVEDAVKYLRGG